MPRKTEAYQCEFCAMTSLRKDSVFRHEQKACKKNPGRRTCHTCKHSRREVIQPSRRSRYIDWFCAVDEEFEDAIPKVDCELWEAKN